MSAESFFLGVGGFVFKVHPMYDRVKTFCRDYILSDLPERAFDEEIYISDRDIETEIQHADFDVSEILRTARDDLYGYYERIALFRKTAELLPIYGATVFHGVLLEMNGEGYLFTAKSGTGKTTHAHNWLKAFPNVRVVNGDKPILRIENDRLMGYGTPWCGKEHEQINEKIPIRAVIWLKRGQINEIEEISQGQMLPTWMAQTYKPTDETAALNMLDLVMSMMDKVKHYCLYCNMDVDPHLLLLPE